MLPFAPSDRTSYPFLPGEYRIKHVTEDWERRGCQSLRRAVFCNEQQIFDSDDRDAVDANAIAIAAIGCIAGMPERVVGTVRIHRGDEAGLWWGSRLAVDRDYRRAAWLGSQLIIHAVSTAHARGGTRFLARVQVQNRRLFERLQWDMLSALEVQGRPHVLMQARLAHYPPRDQDEISFISDVREAA
jgi:putative N-acetyltransferase (TIGR04045 family)